MGTRVIDVSRPLAADTPAWPGDASFVATPTSDHASGAMVSRIELSAHLGTHVDAPLHLLPGGEDAAGIDLGACFGPCHVVAVGVGGGAMGPDRLPTGWKLRHPRVLIATGAWPRGGPLPAGFPGLSTALVDALADAGAVLVGVDTPSVDPPASPDLAAHRRCIERGVVILEALALDGVHPGEYFLAAVPLRLVGVEASPVRAVLAPLAVSPLGPAVS